jgi:hypothetical protein
MAYIGKQPVVGNFVKLDAITTSATATYNLLNGGVAYFPQTANNCIVSLNGVIQSPTSAYTISGSTIIFSDALTASDSIDFILVLGDVLAIGTPSDGTVTSAKLASGTAGLIAWQSVQTTGFTASAGRGYPCNTTSAAFTVTLPASPSVGDTIILLDYAGTFDTNALTINPNSNKIEGGTGNLQLTGEREGTSLVYIDATQGWLASSGINEGTDALAPPPYSVDFLVIAGGGSGGAGYRGAGGGAGGYRNSYSTETSGGGGSSEASLTFTPGTVYTITVGAGGTSPISPNAGNNGNDSSISGTGITTITSIAGGGAGHYNMPSGSGSVGQAGGSGGGGGSGNVNRAGGSGTANQGYAGGSAENDIAISGGGGGAGAVGFNSGSAGTGGTDGDGGAGLASSITGTSVSRAGGGGSGSYNSLNVTVGGTGGGGSGGHGHPTQTIAQVAGTVNTGGGGGGSSTQDMNSSGAAGGSGVVILRMPTANYSGTTTGSPTVTTDGSDKVIVFNSSGSITG